MRELPDCAAQAVSAHPRGPRHNGLPRHRPIR